MVADDIVLDDATSRQTSALKLGKHIIAAAACGFGSAIVVSSILYLVATNQVFSMLFAVSMVLAGVTLGWRAKMQCTSNDTKSMLRLAVGGAGITIMGGVASLLLTFTEGKSSVMFIILYACCSIGALYVLAFIATDVFNRSIRQGKELNAKQLYTIAGAAIVVGSWCGFFFNAVDVEQHVSRFGFEQWVSAAIAALGGVMVGYVNYHATDDALDVTFDPLPMDDFTPTHEGRDFATD
jgi:hypothetical protein